MQKLVNGKRIDVDANEGAIESRTTRLTKTVKKKADGTILKTRKEEQLEAADDTANRPESKKPARTRRGPKTPTNKERQLATAKSPTDEKPAKDGKSKRPTVKEKQLKSAETKGDKPRVKRSK